MPNRPAVVLIDDGELDDLLGTLRELGADPVRVPGVEADGEWLWPSRLLVASARRGPALGPFTSRDKGGCTTIAVAEDDSRTVQALARRMGFDYLVRRPVHPEALRLLLLRALYGDRERRLERRLPIGYTVTWRAGLRAHDATVAEISSGGCRLLTARRLGPGSRLSVHIPRALAGGLGLRLSGRAVRCERRAATQGAPWLLGVAFENLSERARRRLDDLLDRYAIGPPVSRMRAHSPAPKPPPGRAPRPRISWRSRRPRRSPPARSRWRPNPSWPPWTDRLWRSRWTSPK